VVWEKNVLNILPDLKYHSVARVVNPRNQKGTVAVVRPGSARARRPLMAIAPPCPATAHNAALCNTSHILRNRRIFRRKLAGLHNVSLCVVGWDCGGATYASKKKQVILATGYFFGGVASVENTNGSPVRT
jgi:hypothetical protein